MKEYITYHEKPIHRNNYNIILGVNFSNSQHTKFDYCDKNKQWVVFENGNEIGVLTKEGIDFALSRCNPNSELVKQLKQQNV